MGRSGALCLVLLFSIFSNAQNNVLQPEVKEAKWMLERITGVKWPLDSAVITEMAALIGSGDRAKAAEIATNQAAFLNVTVKLMALRMSTREETIRTPFNDFAAAFIGVARDGTDARELLTGDFSYRGDAAKLQGVTVRSNLADDILISNNHFADLESRRVDLSSVLVRVSGQVLISNDQKATVPNPDPAGVLTSRTFLEAHAADGTNRRLVEYAMREFACLPIESWADTNSSDARIGRDIDRFPGGDHLKFQTTCKGCHTVMDGFRGAFAKWDFANSNAIHSDAGGSGRARPGADRSGVMNKMNKNNTVYPGGYVTKDASWVNNAILGTNKTRFGWRGTASSGVGVKAFGTLLANSERFGQCMAKRVFEAVCKKTLEAAKLGTLMAEMGKSFEESNFNLKKLFEAAVLRSECK